MCKYLEIDHQIAAGAEIRIINALLLLTDNVTSGPESPAAFSLLGIDISVCVTRVNGYLAGINILVTLLTTYTPATSHQLHIRIDLPESLCIFDINKSSDRRVSVFKW